MTMTTTLTRGLLVAGLGLGLAACGGGDTKDATPTTAAASGSATTATPGSSGSSASSKKACDVVTAADFTTAFGFDAKDSKEGPGGGLATCTHSGAKVDGTDVTVGLITVRFSPNGAGSFDGEQGGVERALSAKGVAVSGIGDKAIETVGTVSGQLQAWITMTKGSAVVQISVGGLKAEADAKAKVEQLAKAAAGRL
jgi:hypothetical protein